MEFYLCALAFLATLVLIPLLIPVATRLGWVDAPGGRKTHRHRTPLVGGICVAAVVLPALALDDASRFHGLYVYVAASLLILVSGAWDDRWNLPVKARFAVQGAAALVMSVGAGVKVETLGMVPGIGSVDLGVLSVAFTVFATVGLINAFNMMDGRDGVLGGIALALLGVILLAAWRAGGDGVVPLAGLLAAALLAFLVYNFPLPGREHAAVFLGDAGSTWLGFTCAWVVISVAQGQGAPMRPFTALWILALPVMDAVATMSRRLRGGRSPFAADHDHLHFALQRWGLSARQTVTGMTLLTALFGLAGLALDVSGVPDVGLAVLFALVFLGYANILRGPTERPRQVRRIAAPAPSLAGESRKPLMPDAAHTGTGGRWSLGTVVAAATQSYRDVGRRNRWSIRKRSKELQGDH